MSDRKNKPFSVTPEVLEAAHILVMMKQGMRAFLEAQQARYRIPYLYYASLNPAAVSAQLHYLSTHGIPLSPLYDMSPMPAAYQFPLAHAQSFSLPQQEAYYGMLTSLQCVVGPPREQSSAACAVSTEGMVEGETLQPATKKLRLSSASRGSPEQTATEKQDSKRKRKNLTKEQLEILESVYEKDKYPHIDDRIKLEKPTNLTEDRIQVWFQNRRAKDRKRLEAEKLQQYFENSQKATEECKENSTDAKNTTIKTEHSPDRRNSGSEISDNGESDSLSLNESLTE